MIKMKSKFLLPLLASLLLTGCAGGNTPAASSEEASYHVVTFHLNYEGLENDVYQNLVVNKGQNLVKPADPTRQGFLFKDWYSDESLTTVFTGFDAEVTANMDLYASWTDVASVDDETKISMLLEDLKAVSSGANHAYVKQTQSVMYPALGASTPISYYQEKDATRYKDITDVKYYDSEDNDPARTVLAEQQYFHDDQYFYSLIKDYEDDANSSKRTVKYDASQADAFMNVDFLSLYGSDLTKALSYLQDKTKVRVAYGEDDSSSSEEEFIGDYSLETNIDPSAFSVGNDSYSFALALETYTKNESYGWITQSYSTTASIMFLNGKIKRATVQMQYMFALSEGVYEYEVSSETSSFEYGEYADFAGTRFNPADFADASSTN